MDNKLFININTLNHNVMIFLIKYIFEKQYPIIPNNFSFLILI